MRYRRVEDERIHINLVGIGRFGKETIQKFHKAHESYFDMTQKRELRMIINENDVASICNIVYENKVDEENRLVPWNEGEIEGEKRTESLLILVGEATDALFKLYQAAAASLLGNGACKRVVFLRGREATISNVLADQQFNHVFPCGDSENAADMIRLFLEGMYHQNEGVYTSNGQNIRHLFGNSVEVKMFYHSQYASANEETFDVTGLIERCATELTGRIDPFKSYVAYVALEGEQLPTNAEEVKERFENSLRKIQIVDYRLAVSSPLKKRKYGCMICVFDGGDGEHGGRQ